MKIENKLSKKPTNSLSVLVLKYVCFNLKKFDGKYREVRDYVEQLDNHLEDKSSTMVFNCLVILLKTPTY